MEAPRSGQSTAKSQDELAELVRRDRAHPSILAWNVTGFDETATASIRKLDATRFLLQRSGGGPKLWPPNSADARTVGSRSARPASAVAGSVHIRPIGPMWRGSTANRGEDALALSPYGHRIERVVVHEANWLAIGAPE